MAEGVRLVEEAQAAGWETRLLLHTTDLNERGQELVEKYLQQGVAVEAVSADVMSAASDTPKVMQYFDIPGSARPVTLEVAMISPLCQVGCGQVSRWVAAFLGTAF